MFGLLDAARSPHPARGRLAAARAGGPGRPQELASRATCGWPGAHSGAYVLRHQRRQAGVRLARRRRRASSPRTRSCSPPRPRWRASAPTARSGTEVLGDGQLDERRRLARQPLPARRRRPHLRLQHLHAQVLRRRRHGRAARQADRRTPAIERVTGRVYGDESRHDSLRGGPDSGYGVSIWVGPLSALSYNRGLATERGSAFQTNPPAFAAARLDDALEARGIAVRASRPPRTAPARPGRARQRRLAADGAHHPADEQALRQLLRRDARQGRRDAGERPRHHVGRRGAGRRLRAPAGLGRPAGRRLGARRAATAPRPTAWSGCCARCTSASRSSPTRYSTRSRSPAATARWRTGCGAARPATAAAARPARCPTSARCRATARSRSGRHLVFSILMNRVSPTGARRLQDRMLQKIAAQDP